MLHFACHGFNLCDLVFLVDFVIDLNHLILILVSTLIVDEVGAKNYSLLFHLGVYMIILVLVCC